MTLLRLFNGAIWLGLAVITAWLLLQLSSRADVALNARNSAVAAANAPSDALTTQREGSRLTIHFDRGMAPTALVEGWSGSEPNYGTWSIGNRAVLKLTGLPAGPVQLWLRLAPFVTQGLPVQHVRVQAQGRVVAEWRLVKAGTQTLALDVPEDARAADGSVVLKFDLPDADAPARYIPGSKDAREVAVKLEVLEASVVQPGAPRA